MDRDFQTSLFSEANRLLDDACEALRNFEFDVCISLVKQAKEIDPAIANADFYRDLATWCRDAGLNSESSAKAIAELWQVLKSRMLEVGGASVKMQEKCKLFAQRLRFLDDFDRYGYVADADYPLHEGTCALHIGKFQAAYDLLLDASQNTDRTFTARNWGHLGDAAYALGKFTEANTAYVRLLVKDPFQIDWSTLKNENLRSIFTEIAATESLDMAYGRMPYFAWSHKVISITERNTFIPEEINFYSENPEETNPKSTAQKAHIFALYVFAENMNRNNSPDAEQRKLMRDLAPDLFEDYLSRQHR